MPELLALLLPVAALAEDVGSGAGWASAGLLSGVIGWLLLKHLPESSDRFERMQRRNDERSDEREAKMFAVFKESLSQVLEHGDRRNAELVAAIREDLQAIREEFRRAGGPPGSAVHAPLPQGNRP